MKKSTPHRRVYDIACDNLRQCFTPSGIIAGTHHFVDVWARDSLFGSFGALTIKEFDVVKQTLETFLSHQRGDGLIPYRIQRSPTTIGKYFGHPSYYREPRVNYRSHQSGGLVPDGGLMTVITMAQYSLQVGDRAFLRKHYAHVCRAIDWYRGRFGDNLIREWFQCEWADAVLKTGTTAYTNVLYAKALSDICRIATDIGDKLGYIMYKKRYEKIIQLLGTTFWNGSYFADWYDYKRQDYFASHPNMLAVIFGITAPSQTRSIMHYAKNMAWNGWALLTNAPRYPRRRIPPFQYLVGLPDYHNGMIWLQPTLCYALALDKAGDRREAIKVLSGISKKIQQYNGVYEVYEKDGRPVKRLLYRSEGPFAWSAGLFLLAHQQIHGG